MSFLAKSKKAVAGGVATAVAMYPSVAEDGVSLVDACVLGGAFVGGFLVVWFTPKNAEA